MNRKYGSASAVHQAPINPTNRIYTRRICLRRTQNTFSDFLKLRNNCVIEIVRRKFLQDVIGIDNESSCHDADQKLKCVITTHRFLLEGFAYMRFGRTCVRDRSKMRRDLAAHFDDDNIVTGTWILFFSRDQLEADFRRGMISGESKTGQSQLAND